MEGRKRGLVARAQLGLPTELSCVALMGRGRRGRRGRRESSSVSTSLDSLWRGHLQRRSLDAAGDETRTPVL